MSGSSSRERDTSDFNKTPVTEYFLYFHIHTVHTYIYTNALSNVAEKIAYI